MRSQLAQQMFEGCHGVIENHPWSDPSHDVFDLCLHVRTIAMHGALFASRFVLSESASVQATVGIIQQSLTLRAERMIPFLLATVDSNHLLDHLLFFFRSQFFCHDVQGTGSRQSMESKTGRKLCLFTEGNPCQCIPVSETGWYTCLFHLYTQ